MTIKYIKSALTKLFAFLITLTPIALLAANVPEYEPLSGIPWLKTENSMIDYINFLYNVAIFLGVSIGVLIIAKSGIEYMTTEVYIKKGTALKRIQDVFIGLLILLSIHLILRTIDPDIVALEMFR